MNAPQASAAAVDAPDPAAWVQKIEDLAVSAITDASAIRRSLPDVAAHVLELCQLAYTDAIRIENAVTKDPFISGQLVAVANSAMFAPRMPIIGVRDAVVRLGLDNVCDIVMMVVSNSTMYRVRGFEAQVERMRKRGLGTALAARVMSRLLKSPAEYAFLAGLLHDIGELILLERCVAVGGLTPAIMEDPQDGPLVRATIARLHTELGAGVCRIWKLPPSVIDAAAFHHNCRRGDNRYLATAVVAAADVIAEHLGLGEVQQPLDPTNEVFVNLGLSPDQVSRCAAEVEKSLPEVLSGH